MSMNCAIMMGKHTYRKQAEDCCVCLENKIMLILKCNHKVCWYNITKKSFGNDFHSPKCPLCRNINDWSE